MSDEQTIREALMRGQNMDASGFDYEPALDALDRMVLETEGLRMDKHELELTARAHIAQREGLVARYEKAIKDAC